MLILLLPVCYAQPVEGLIYAVIFHATLTAILPIILFILILKFFKKKLDLRLIGLIALATLLFLYFLTNGFFIVFLVLILILASIFTILIFLIKFFKKEVDLKRLISAMLLALFVSAIIAFPLTIGAFFLKEKYYEYAVMHPKSLEQCKKYPRHESTCMTQYAVITNNPTVCLAEQEVDYRDTCFYDYAIATHQKDVCLRISDESTKSNCLGEQVIQ